MMDRWNAAGAKVLSRDKRKSSPRWFELSAEELLPAIEEKKRATRKCYKDGDASSKIKMTEPRRQVADLVEAAKIRWIEKKAEEMENRYDPRGAWRAMREISAMFAGHMTVSKVNGQPIDPSGTTTVTLPSGAIVTINSDGD